MRLCVIESHCAHRDPLVLTHSSQHYSLRIDLRRRGYDAAIDLGSVAAAAEKLAYIAEREGKPTGAPVEYEEFHFHHQVPGGMISNLKYQLGTVGMADRLEEILEEAGRVRADLGYPIVVSPFAQYIMTQAVLNVPGKERYATVPAEVRRYVLGGSGTPPGRVAPAPSQVRKNAG